MIKQKYILATHVWNDGPAQAFQEYLIKQKYDFLWIGHPLFYSEKITGSGYSIFIEGQEVRKRYFKARQLSGPIKYVLEILLNILFTWRLKSNQEYIYIGYNNLNAFSGILLKKTGRVAKTIYYVIDYTPQRFSNSFLNYIYHKIDQFCIKYSDETWSLNERAMNNARKKFYNFDAYQQGFSDQKEIPMGFWKERISLKTFDEINKKQLVFMGSILEKQGVQFVLKALPKVIKNIPGVNFVVIGSGEYLDTLKRLTVELNINDNVEFTGFIKDLKDIEDILLNSAFAIAIYEEGNPKTNFTYYTDQGKIKNYLGCGLPILLSNVPPIATEIEKNKCGFVIDNNPTHIASKIVEVLNNEQKLKFYRDNVIKYRERFDWDIIFKDMLGKTANILL